MQALNYCSKAIDQIDAMPVNEGVFTEATLRFLRQKLAVAQKFILPDSGELLDRQHPRPQVDGLTLRPPFPVVALEYACSRPAEGGFYHSIRSSRRIALAWEVGTGGNSDWPAPLGQMLRAQISGPGVCVVSISYLDHLQMWSPGMAAMFMPFEGDWERIDRLEPYQAARVASGAIKHRIIGSHGFPMLAVPLALETIRASIPQAGSFDAVIDAIRSDTADEVSSYFDLCLALACRNVSTERMPADEKLNRTRIKSGKRALFDYHILNIGAAAGAGGVGTREAGTVRTHLRRGHIRRIGGGRVTWVNATMVNPRGAGFAAKDYAVGARP